jgi:hypothetical protein
MVAISKEFTMYARLFCFAFTLAVLVAATDANGLQPQAPPAGLHASTNLSVYDPRDTVVVSIENGSTDSIAVFWQCLSDPRAPLYLWSWILERQGVNGWEPFNAPPCTDWFPPIPLQLDPGSSYIFWVLTGEPGRYRVKLGYNLEIRCCVAYSIYTNEFQAEDTSSVRSAPWSKVKATYK